MKIIYILIILLSTTLFSFDNNQEKEILKLSSKDKLSKAASMISVMDSSLSEAYAILKKTRKEKDVIKLNCVNESISKIKGLLKRSKDDSMSLQEAISKDDTKSSNYYFTKISLASNNIKQYSIEVLSCSGTITIEADPVVGISVEDLIVEKDYLEVNENSSTDEINSNVKLEPIQVSPYF